MGKSDAEKSVELNPSYEKAYLRLGFVNELLQHYKEAYNAYKKVICYIKLRLSSYRETRTRTPTRN